MGGGAAALQKDVPWRASSGAKPIPKIHYSPVLRIPQNPLSDYALSIMKHPDPIGSGLGTEAIVEAAGPDCIVPGQNPPIKLLGLKVWPIEVDLKFMEPVGRELKSVGKFMDSAVDLMNKSFIDPTLASYIRRVTLLVCGNHKYSLMASQLTMQEEELRRGQWLEEEDERLSMMVAVFGERRWDALAKTSGLKRSGKSCRLRWLNYLRPNLKHGHITADEERLIIRLQKQFGNKWSKIAKQLPGRTDNEIKNYWRSHLRKKTLIYKQDSSGNSTSNSEQRSSILKRDTVLNSSSNSEDTYSEKGDCSSADFFAYSSNEATLLDWIPSWSYEQSRMEHHMYFCSSNLCSCYPP